VWSNGSGESWRACSRGRIVPSTGDALELGEEGGVKSMCEIKAYGLRDDGEELLLESVIRVEPQGADTWRLLSLFGEERLVRGKFQRADFRENKVYFALGDS
jgi:predicted RNA-binding protein